MSLRYFKLGNRILDRNRVVSVGFYRRTFVGLWQRSKPYQVAIEYEGLTPLYFILDPLPIVIPFNNMLRATGIYINFATEKEARDAAAKVERLRIKEFAE